MSKKLTSKSPLDFHQIDILRYHNDVQIKIPTKFNQMAQSNLPKLYLHDKKQKLKTKSTNKNDIQRQQFSRPCCDLAHHIDDQTQINKLINKYLRCNNRKQSQKKLSKQMANSKVSGVQKNSTENLNKKKYIKLIEHKRTNSNITPIPERDFLLYVPHLHQQYQKKLSNGDLSRREQNETKHKVINRNFRPLMLPPLSDYEYNQNKQISYKLNTESSQQQWQQSEEESSKKSMNMYTGGLNTTSKKRKNHTEFYIQEQNQDDQQNIKKSTLISRKKTIGNNSKLEQKRIKTQQQEIQRNNTMSLNKTKTEQQEIQKNDIRLNKLQKSVSPMQSQKKQISIQVQTINLKNINRLTTNTLFLELFKKQPYQKQLLRQSRSKSQLSAVTSETYHVPLKQELPKFIQRYKPMDAAFDLKEIVKLPNFQIVKSKNGIYLGEMKDQKREGFGIFINQKSIFEGQFSNNLKVKGTQSTSQGKYKGMYLNGLRQGHGQFIWANQQSYKGQWKAGMKHGHGVWKSPNGNFYDGQWVNNKQQGTGTHIHKGSIYKGEFKNFLKQGKGEQKFANGDTYIGQYKNGKPNGKGQYLWVNGFKYKGQFLNGLRNGQGVIQENGNIYQAVQVNLKMILKTDQVKQFIKTVRNLKEDSKKMYQLDKENTLMKMAKECYMIAIESIVLYFKSLFIQTNKYVYFKFIYLIISNLQQYLEFYFLKPYQHFKQKLKPLEKLNTLAKIIQGITLLLGQKLKMMHQFRLSIDQVTFKLR